MILGVVGEAFGYGPLFGLAGLALLVAAPVTWWGARRRRAESSAASGGERASQILD